jgi:tRNA/rRNA methyltransferase
MAFWTYILHCADRTYYTGHTDNLERRIAQHQSGEIKGYTSERRPVELVWADYFQTRADAQAAEMKIKGWSQAKKKALIAENWDSLKRLAIPPSERRVRASASLGTVPRLRSGKTELREVTPLTTPTAPVIILVRPQLGENIGKAARAMLNFGLTEMRLVAPRDGWPNPKAGPSSSGADSVLENAKVYDTLGEAIADINYIYATTVRKRGVTKPVLTPEVAAKEIFHSGGRSAILFGMERSGLAVNEVAAAQTIITVPINPEFSSLNLAQAVVLVAYEWSKYQSLAIPTSVTIDPPAPHGEFEEMIGALFEILERRGYFYPVERTAVTQGTVRNLMTKARWNSLELRTFRGVLSVLNKGKRDGRDTVD